MGLAELKARVDAAEGPDRKIDAALYWHLLEQNREERPLPWVEMQFCEFAANGDWRQPYTSSLDAALGLVEAKIPGCDWRLELDRETQPSPPYWAWVDPNDGVSGPLCAQGSFPSLALLSALLSALMAEEVMA